VKSKPPALVIFDCDGVLVDTERLAVPIDVEILSELGWEMPASEVAARFLGKSAADVMKEIEAHLGRPVPPEISFEHERRYTEAFERHLRPVEGVVRVLDILDEAGVATCVASGGTHEKMRFTLGLTGLYERFQGRIFSAGDVARGKPAPDLFLYARATAASAVAPADCAVVEDSPFGLEAALAAGMGGFGYVGGLVPLERLRLPGTVVFEKMEDLPQLLGLQPG
jgi:HAD superfamily hydrolase (TIGR01509 family)